MKIACIIEARMTSTRLPGKVLRPILGKPMIERMIERIRFCRTIDQVIVATTEKTTDDPVMKLADQLGVGIFRGSEVDVLARVLAAAEKYEVDLIVEVPGDCPLVDPGLIDKMVADFLVGGVDFVRNAMDYNTPPGADIRVFRTSDLREINKISQDPADHEHVSIYFYEHPEKYRLREVTTALSLREGRLRLTVDTQEDFDLVTHIFEALYAKNNRFNLGDIIEFLDLNPTVRALNEGIFQKDVR